MLRPTPIAAFNPLERVTFPHLESLIAKIFRIRHEHKQLDLIADFDHTLTQHRLGDQKCDSLFGMWVTNPNISADFRRELMENYRQYGPYETDPTLEFHEKLKFVEKLYHVQRGLFEKHGVTRHHATEVLANSQLAYRAHVL